MPLSIIVGGQFGSEGKGKTSLHWAQTRDAQAVVRVGGTNSGHTVIDRSGTPVSLRQLPTAAVLPSASLILPAGSYIDPPLLFAEMERYNVDPARVMIDPNAAIITDADKRREEGGDLRESIGSTASGTGSAVIRRAARDGSLSRARDIKELIPFLTETIGVTRDLLDAGARIVIEGTQGFGLSVLHGGNGDYATSRDTTAAGFLSEVGLSPFDVDEVVMVIRAFPIRVSGNSGPLPNETDWSDVSERAGRPGLKELTTVTGKLRRVAEFDPEIVRRAIRANQPSSLVLNHMDYVSTADVTFPAKAAQFVRAVEADIGRGVDYIGLGPGELIERSKLAPKLSASRNQLQLSN